MLKLGTVQRSNIEYSVPTATNLSEIVLLKLLLALLVKKIGIVNSKQ